MPIVRRSARQHICDDFRGAGVDPRQVVQDLAKSGFFENKSEPVQAEPVQLPPATDLSALNGLQLHVHIGSGTKTVQFSDGSEATITETPERMKRRVVRDPTTKRITKIVDEPAEDE